ncbi:MAG: AraC family transcriptional regulator N-terminal domain-containing protein [Thermoanaerobaculia bacterium]
MRLLRLLDSPAEERVLRPLITREIGYRFSGLLSRWNG